MAIHSNQYLVLSFRLAGADDLQVRSATRIKVDGNGSLVVYESPCGAGESIRLGDLQSFRIDYLKSAAPFA